MTLDEVVAINQDQVEHYGGSSGVHDYRALLKSAIAMPAATFGGQYLHTDLSEMAAAYLFHLVQNHPFIDGNKPVQRVSQPSILDAQRFATHRRPG